LSFKRHLSTTLTYLVNSAMTDRQTDRHESSSGDDIITSRDMIDYVGDEVVNSRLQITEAAWNAGMPPHGHPAVRIGTLVHCIGDDDGCVILSATVDDDIYKGHCTALHCRMHSRLWYMSDGLEQFIDRLHVVTALPRHTHTHCTHRRPIVSITDHWRLTSVSSISQWLTVSSFVTNEWLTSPAAHTSQSISHTAVITHTSIWWLSHLDMTWHDGHCIHLHQPLLIA